MVLRPAKSEVVNVELVDEIQVHEHAEGCLQADDLNLDNNHIDLWNV